MGAEPTNPHADPALRGRLWGAKQRPPQREGEALLQGGLRGGDRTPEGNDNVLMYNFVSIKKKPVANDIRPTFVDISGK